MDETGSGRTRDGQMPRWRGLASIQRRGNNDAIADLLLQAVESTLFGVKDVETMTGNGGMDGKFSHGRQTLENLMEEAKKWCCGELFRTS